MNTLPLDEDSCYEACAGREHAWDGHFVLAVTSTGIYCVHYRKRYMFLLKME